MFLVLSVSGVCSVTEIGALEQLFQLDLLDAQVHRTLGRQEGS